MNYYPSGTDLRYFDDPRVEETEPNGDETVECLHYDCRKEFDLTPDGAQMVGGDEGEYQWWAFDAECPHCGDIANYGECD